MFLYNPISHHHINLPPICDDQVTKLVILSCSPDENEHNNCRAVMIHNRIGSLAFCCPGLSQEWTPLLAERAETAYEDIAYSKRRNLFFGLDQEMYLETWDLSVLSSPTMVKVNPSPAMPVDMPGYDDLTEDEKYHYFLKNDLMDVRDNYLVVAEEDDDVVLVSRYTNSVENEETRSGVRYMITEKDSTPGRTICFDDQSLKGVESSTVWFFPRGSV